MNTIKATNERMDREEQNHFLLQGKFSKMIPNSNALFLHPTSPQILFILNFKNQDNFLKLYVCWSPVKTKPRSQIARLVSLSCMDKTSTSITLCSV